MERRSYRFPIRGSGRKYLLLPGSELLRSGYWARATKNEVKGLIKRFATRENQCRRKGNGAYRWRSYRLKAVGVYERRFERVPEVFRGWKLPPMKSYYVRDGRYVWPEHGDPGRLAFPRSQKITGEVTGEVERLVLALRGRMSRVHIQQALGLRHEDHFRAKYLIPALQSGFVEMTIPDRPKSSRQQYRLTAKAEALRAKLPREKGG